MRGDESYAVLGLRPGAPRAEIDQAYRRLIKRYHPDHAGGDAGRAAEVNRAYTELRALSRQPQRQQRPPPPSPAGRPRQIAARRRPGWLGPVVLIAGIGAGVLFAQSTGVVGPGQAPWQQDWSFDATPMDGRSAHRAAFAFNLDDPVSTDMIDRSIDDAISLDVAENSALAAEVSRDCLSRLGSSPSLPLFDFCAAYDEAVSILAADSPGFDSGPFNPLAVTARQVGAARQLSADPVESESRLQQIRSRVQMILLPKLADSGRTAARKVAATAPPRSVSPPRSASPPAVAVAAAAPSRSPRPKQRVRPLASVQPRARPAFVQPQRVRSVAAAQPRQAPAARRPAPRPPAETASTPQWQRPITPEWQKPIKPAWQRPIAPAAGS